MARAISEKTKAIYDYLVAHDGENLTSGDIAKALGVDRRAVDGGVTAGLCRKGYAARIPAEIELEDGTTKTVKFITLTAEGRSYDHDAAVAADAEASAKK